MKKIIQSTKRFEKSLKKLDKILKEKFIKKLDLFIDNEFESNLKTHKLKWDKKNNFSFSFSITDDVRVIYKKEIQWEIEILIFTLIDIWSHNKVYW